MAGIYTFVYHVALFGIEAKKENQRSALESFLGQRLKCCDTALQRTRHGPKDSRFEMKDNFNSLTLKPVKISPKPISLQGQS